eukprot:scaffold996_cov409-Prasinococcus_capsulatus_cf.AAC.7
MPAIAPLTARLELATPRLVRRRRRRQHRRPLSPRRPEHAARGRRRGKKACVKVRWGRVAIPLVIWPRLGPHRYEGTGGVAAAGEGWRTLAPPAEATEGWVFVILGQVPMSPLQRGVEAWCGSRGSSGPPRRGSSPCRRQACRGPPRGTGPVDRCRAPFSFIFGP